MHNIVRTAVLAALIVSPLTADASEARIRIESSGGDVKVVLVDESVTSVGVSVPGVISGETLTVEAPARRVTLEGGTIGPDRLLEAEVARKVRNTSGQTPTVIVIGAKERTRYETPGYVSPVYAIADYAYVPVYRAPIVRPVRNHSRTIRPRQQEGRRATRSPSRSRGSFSSRGMMPRR